MRFGARSPHGHGDRLFSIELIITRDGLLSRVIRADLGVTNVNEPSAKEPLDLNDCDWGNAAVSPGDCPPPDPRAKR